tara:strand:- start:1123 stop:1584 length:462 start_codon:yes stop_codon:yes gene_type:complete
MRLGMLPFCKAFSTRAAKVMAVRQKVGLSGYFSYRGEMMETYLFFSSSLSFCRSVSVFVRHTWHFRAQTWMLRALLSSIPTHRREDPKKRGKEIFNSNTSWEPIFVKNSENNHWLGRMTRSVQSHKFTVLSRQHCPFGIIFHMRKNTKKGVVK